MASALTSAQVNPANAVPRLFRLVLGENYLTNGITIDFSAFGGRSFFGLVAATSALGALKGDRYYAWDNDVQKLVAFDAVGTEEGNATDLTGDALFFYGYVI